MTKRFLGSSGKCKDWRRKIGLMIYPGMVCINGYITTTVGIQVMFLRGQVGPGPRVQIGREDSMSAIFIAC